MRLDYYLHLRRHAPLIEVDTRKLDHFKPTPDAGVDHEVAETVDLLPELVDLERTAHQLVELVLNNIQMIKSPVHPEKDIVLVIYQPILGKVVTVMCIFTKIIDELHLVLVLEVKLFIEKETLVLDVVDVGEHTGILYDIKVHALIYVKCEYNRKFIIQTRDPTSISPPTSATAVYSCIFPPTDTVDADAPAAHVAPQRPPRVFDLATGARRVCCPRVACRSRAFEWNTCVLGYTQPRMLHLHLFLKIRTFFFLFGNTLPARFSSPLLHAGH